MIRLLVLIFAAAVAGYLVGRRTASECSLQVNTSARLSNGNLGRLQRVMAKARRGDPLTIGFIGGSITNGQDASAAERQYANRVTRWWSEQFPQSRITMVNAGVRGTGSNYGCLRLKRDLLAHHPDFVVVEFGVNDRDDLTHAQTYEGVVRQLMADAQQPAVVLLFMMHSDGTNAQATQSQIGLRYELPMISFRDAMWPQIIAGRIKHSDVYADSVHPNDRGHVAIAGFINSLLEDAKKLPVESIHPHLPQPRFTDLFCRTRLIEAQDLHPTVIDGWKYDQKKHVWSTAIPGSTIEFQMPGQVIDLLYGQVSADGGTVSVSVDGGPEVLCDGWFDGTWQGHCQTDAVGQDLQTGMHHVRIQLINQSNAFSTGHTFEIWGLASAGN